MNDLRELYQETILDHYREPRNFGRLESANRKAEGYNPLCGDKVTLYLNVQDGIIRDLRFEGSGCAIATASASIMTECLKGKSEEEALHQMNNFHCMVTGQNVTGAQGKQSILAGISEFPERIKCATLAWHTLNAALDNRTAPKPVSTE